MTLGFFIKKLGKLNIGLSILYLILMAASGPALTLLLGQFIESLVDQNQEKYILYICLMSGTVCFNATISTIYIHQQVVNNSVITAEMIKVYLKSNYYVSTPVGKPSELTSKLFELPMHAAKLLAAFTDTLQNGLAILFYQAVIFSKSYELGLIFFAQLFGSLLISFLTTKQRKKYIIREEESKAKVGAHIGDSFSNWKTIKSYNNEESFTTLLYSKLSILHKERKRLSWAIALPTSAIVFLTFLVNAITTFLLFYGYISFVVGALITLFTSSIRATTAVTKFAARLRDTMDLNRKKIKNTNFTVPNQGQKISQYGAHLRYLYSFNDVRFSYPNTTKHALHNFSTELPEKGLVMIVGPSGSGKSTLISLLLKVGQPEGAIQLDNRNLNSISAEDYLQGISYVPQEVVLLSGTIEDNIRFGRTSESFADVQQAASSAAADPFISLLPEGYKSIVGDGGISLSGGQCQRILIARALLKNPQVLLLDEVTSALDTNNEQIIMFTLSQLARKILVILVEHKIANCKLADLILVMNKGTLIEQGTYNSLVQSQGFFYSMLQVKSEENSTRNERSLTC